MKRAEIQPGDRIRVRPWFSTMPEHWGTFQRFNHGGHLLYEADHDSRAFSRNERTLRCCWRDVEEIVPMQEPQ